MATAYQQTATQTSNAYQNIANAAPSINIKSSSAAPQTQPTSIPVTPSANQSHAGQTYSAAAGGWVQAVGYTASPQNQPSPNSQPMTITAPTGSAQAREATSQQIEKGYTQVGAVSNPETGKTTFGFLPPTLTTTAAQGVYKLKDTGEIFPVGYNESHISAAPTMIQEQTIRAANNPEVSVYPQGMISNLGQTTMYSAGNIKYTNIPELPESKMLEKQRYAEAEYIYNKQVAGLPWEHLPTNPETLATELSGGSLTREAKIQQIKRDIEAGNILPEGTFQQIPYIFKKASAENPLTQAGETLIISTGLGAGLGAARIAASSDSVIGGTIVKGAQLAAIPMITFGALEGVSAGLRASNPELSKEERSGILLSTGLTLGAGLAGGIAGYRGTIEPEIIKSTYHPTDVMIGENRILTTRQPNVQTVYEETGGIGGIRYANAKGEELFRGFTFEPVGKTIHTFDESMTLQGSKIGGIRYANAKGEELFRGFTFEPVGKTIHTFDESMTLQGSKGTIRMTETAMPNPETKTTSIFKSIGNIEVTGASGKTFSMNDELSGTGRFLQAGVEDGKPKVTALTQSSSKLAEENLYTSRLPDIVVGKKGTFAESGTGRIGTSTNEVTVGIRGKATTYDIFERPTIPKTEENVKLKDFMFNEKPVTTSIEDETAFKSLVASDQDITFNKLGTTISKPEPIVSSGNEQVTIQELKPVEEIGKPSDVLAEKTSNIISQNVMENIDLSAIKPNIPERITILDPFAAGIGHFIAIEKPKREIGLMSMNALVVPSSQYKLPEQFGIVTPYMTAERELAPMLENLPLSSYNLDTPILVNVPLSTQMYIPTIGTATSPMLREITPTIQTTENPTIPPTTFPPTTFPPPPIPIIPIGLPNLSLPSGENKKQKPLFVTKQKRNYRYSPSLEGIFFNVKARKTEGIFTGLEARGLPAMPKFGMPKKLRIR
jgi:hypothetical protein